MTKRRYFKINQTLNTNTLMNTVKPAETEAKVPSLKIKGRMMLQEKFTSRLQNMCNSLGFENVKIPESLNFGILDGFSDTGQNRSGRDAVSVLSCKVYYDPNWGGYCGQPQLRARIEEGKDEFCPAGFLAPFLQMYNRAQKQIVLTETRQGSHLITLPKIFLNDDEKRQESKLIMDLGKVAEPDENGAIVPTSTAGSRFSYRLSANLRELLDAQNFTWRPGRPISIGQFLGGELFSFSCAETTVTQNNPFYSTLFPHLRHLVTHRTPHLRAAEIHLQHQFTRKISMLTTERRAALSRLLCLAGLEIDMAPFAGHEEKYFVPWQAYIEGVDRNESRRCSLEQDELLVQLRQ